MGLRLPDILGLTIGFTLGGSALAAYLALSDDARTRAPAQADTIVPKATAPRPAEPPPVIVAVAPKAEPAPLPRVNRPDAHPPAPRLPDVPPPNPRVSQGASGLPNVVHPTDQSKPGTISGTGFFIQGDGTILTAAHVVDGCRETRVVSSYLKPARATILARDAGHDIALLRAKVTPPALLGLTTTATGNRQLLVYGYPSHSDPLVPTEAQARVRADLSQQLGWPRERSPGMWLDASEVRPGFSGGPVITADGEAIGLVMATIRRHPQATGADPTPSGVAIGPDTQTITRFLRREAPDVEPGGDWRQQASDTLAARKAVVHVYCLR